MAIVTSGAKFLRTGVEGLRFRLDDTVIIQV